MADLNRDRGQLILVTAFALAAIFLGLAIIVNSAIFTENLATRSENVDSTEALEYRYSAEQFTGNVMQFANENNFSTHDTIWRNVNDGIRDINDYSARQRVRDGAAVSLQLNGTINGSRIFQSSGTDFTSNTSSGDWTLAQDVEQTRALEINASSLPSPGNEFRIIANDTDSPSIEEWAVKINNTDVVVERNGVGTRSCPVSSDVSLDITGATVDGEPCPALQDTESGEELFFAAGIGDDYAIQFENPTVIEGSYSLVVDNKSLNTTLYADPGDPGNGPRQTAAMYSAIVDLEYETPGIEYEAGVRVAPGEPG